MDFSLIWWLAKYLAITIRISFELIHVPNMLPNTLQKSTVLLLFDLTVVLWALKSTNKIRHAFQWHEVIQKDLARRLVLVRHEGQDFYHKSNYIVLFSLLIQQLTQLDRRFNRRVIDNRIIFVYLRNFLD